jgi:formimidoylglutamate deiminase
MSERLVAAAHRAGIGITLLPALYVASGFGGAAPEAVQKRFTSSVEWLLGLTERLSNTWRSDPDVRIGMAPHSLRAVPPAALRECVTGAKAAGLPIHIHVAEQVKEVEDSKSALGQRPVEWLLSNLEVDARFCLVHATHVTPLEIEAIAKSGAVVCLCPTTEANLGDGIAPAAELLSAGVRIGIGSDSHVSVSPTEELRWLEYTQRLTRLRRNVLSVESEPATGERLIRAALVGGAQALGRSIGEIAAGARADLVVLDSEHAVLAGRPLERVLDAWVFVNHRSPIRDVMVGGRWVVKDGVHRERAAVLADYRRALAQIAS